MINIQAVIAQGRKDLLSSQRLQQIYSFCSPKLLSTVLQALSVAGSVGLDRSDVAFVENGLNSDLLHCNLLDCNLRSSFDGRLGGDRLGLRDLLKESWDLGLLKTLALRELSVGLGNGLCLDFRVAKSEADNAAADGLTHSLLAPAVVGVSTGIKDHSAAQDRVRTRELNKKVTGQVSSLALHASVDLLNVTNTALIDVVVGVSLLGTEWVVNLSSGLATVLEVTELLDLEGVHARREASELTLHLSEFLGGLGESDAASGFGVAKEVELASSLDSLLQLGGSSVVAVDWGSVVGLDVARTDGGAARVSEAANGGLADSIATTNDAARTVLTSVADLVTITATKSGAAEAAESETLVLFSSGCTGQEHGQRADEFHFLF